MKTLRTLFVLMLVSLFAAQVNAQGNSQNPNGEAVISVVEVEDNGDGTATLVIKISGNLSGTVDVVTYKVEGNVIPGGIFSSFIDHSKLLVPNPIFVTSIPVIQIPSGGNGNQPEFVEVEIEYTAHTGSRKKSKKACAVKQAGNKEHPFIR
jgi:hypothetical protein